VLVRASNQDLKISISINENDRHCVLMTETFIEFKCNENVVVENITEIKSHYIAKVKHLQPNVRYMCSARVKNKLGMSEQSEISEFMTLQDCKMQ
jgi:hypothetical protein